MSATWWEMDRDDAFEEYTDWNYQLGRLFDDEEEHDKIMEHIYTSGVTSEDARWAFYRWGYLHRNSTPLQWAVRYGRTDVLNSLILEGFDPHMPYRLGDEYSDAEEWFYLIHSACRSGKPDVIKALVEDHHVKVNVTTNNSETVLMSLLDSGLNPDTMLENVHYLIKKGSRVKHTADLAFCVKNNMHGVAEFLISCGANMGPKPPEWRSPLMHATESENLPMIKLLVEGGARIGGLEGMKLLLVGVVQNNLEMVKYCCSLGIDPDTSDRFKPALHFAVEYEAYEVARYLVVDVNVSPDRKGLKGETVFERAFRKKNVHFVELFINAGYEANKEACLNKGHEEEDLEELPQNVLDSVARCTLKTMCVFLVRRSLGRNPNHRIQQLPIPSRIKELLQLDHIPKNLPRLDSQHDLEIRRRKAKWEIACDEKEALSELSLISSSGNFKKVS